jgi:hypothetical protein
VDSALELGFEQVADAAGAPGEIKHTLAHSKPTRPGRGKARLIKKEEA